MSECEKWFKRSGSGFGEPPGKIKWVLEEVFRGGSGETWLRRVYMEGREEAVKWTGGGLREGRESRGSGGSGEEVKEDVLGNGEFWVPELLVLRC